MPSLLLPGACLGLVSGLLVTACADHAGPPGAVEASPQRVEVVTADRGAGVDTFELPGTVRPYDQAILEAKITGTVSERPVVLGQVVAAGELLLRLDAPELEARVLQVRARYEQARGDLARERTLEAQNATARDNVRRLENELEALAAALREAETLRSFQEIRAPFAGVVTSLSADTGDLAAPGKPLVGLEGTDRFQVELELPQRLRAAVVLGQPLLVRSPGDSFTALPEEVSPAADPATRTSLVKLAVPGEVAVHSGDFVRVEVPSGSRNVVTIPETARREFGQMEQVFVVEDGRARLRLVRTVPHVDGRREVLAGLQGGEALVQAPTAALRDGALVQIVAP